jgi:nucleotide-binding universal stress UspA family protein
MTQQITTLPKVLAENAEFKPELLPVRRILCAADFSECSQAALGYALGLSRRFGARLYVQHVVPPPAYLYAEPAAAQPVADQMHAARKAAEWEIPQMIRGQGGVPSEARVMVSEGDAPTGILETIAKESIDLLVMGTHGHKGFSRLMLGSVAEGMIHRASCPVFVVSRAAVNFAPGPEVRTLHMDTILLATDFSADSDRALAYALRWGYEWGAKLVVFHAVPEASSTMHGLADLFPEYNPVFEGQMTRAWELIHHLVPEAAQRDLHTVFEVRHGDPKTEVLKVAQEKGADLIIMGARGTSSIAVPWGSVSSHVVRGSELPVMVVRRLGT